MKDCSREGVDLAGYIGGDGVEVREEEVVDFGGVLNGSGYEGVWGWERRLCFSLEFWAKSTMRSNLSFPHDPFIRYIQPDRLPNSITQRSYPFPIAVYQYTNFHALQKDFNGPLILLDPEVERPF